MPEQLLSYLPYLPYVYLGVISLIAIVVTLYDKSIAGYAAKKTPKNKDGSSNRNGPRLRVPEATLLILSALGGSVAMLLTMLLVRHKTKKAKFMVGIPAIIVLQVAAVVALLVLL